MGTRRCSFHQARISGLVAAEWVAAALLTTPPLTPPLKSLLLSERLPATVAAALERRLSRQRYEANAFTLEHVYRLLAWLLLWGAAPWKLAAVAQYEGGAV